MLMMQSSHAPQNAALIQIKRLDQFPRFVSEGILEVQHRQVRPLDQQALKLIAKPNVCNSLTHALNYFFNTANQTVIALLAKVPAQSTKKLTE
jgi:hypothetical protein